MTPRIAVIGGGAAGLLAAARLQALGADPYLLEAEATPGGVIRTIRRDGWIAEAGPNTLSEPDPIVRALLDAAGLAPRTLRAERSNARRFLVHQGRLVAVPRSAGELVSWPVLSAAGRMRLLKEPFIKAGPGDAEESVDSFIRRRLGDEMAERVFDPLIGGATAGDPAQLLVRYALPRLLEWEQLGGSLLKGAMRSGMEARRRAGKAGEASLGIWSCPNGLMEVVTHLAALLGPRIRCGVRIAAVTPAGAGFDVVDHLGQRERFDRVLCAVPARAFETLSIGVADSHALGEVAGIPHASLASVSLGFRRGDVAHPLDGYGVLAPFCERRQILGTLFASSLFPQRAPDGHVLLTSLVGGIRRPELAALGEPELVALVREELESLLGVRGAPCFSAVTVWRDSQPQAVSRHTTLMDGVASLEGSHVGLAFAGAWHDGLALADVMRGGCRAADRLMERMQ